MALKQISTNVVMGQPNGATFPIWCNGLTDSEVPNIKGALELEKSWKLKYHGNVWEESTFSDGTMVLPVPVKDLAKKRDKTVQFQFRNANKQSLFLKIEVPIDTTTGDTSDIDTIAAAFKGKTLGATFGSVEDVQFTITNGRRK